LMKLQTLKVVPLQSNWRHFLGRHGPLYTFNEMLEKSTSLHS
jgi:hypothetical protein